MYYGVGKTGAEYFNPSLIPLVSGTGNALKSFGDGVSNIGLTLGKTVDATQAKEKELQTQKDTIAMVKNAFPSLTLGDNVDPKTAITLAGAMQKENKVSDPFKGANGNQWVFKNGVATDTGVPFYSEEKKPQLTTNQKGEGVWVSPDGTVKPANTSIYRAPVYSPMDFTNAKLSLNEELPTAKSIGTKKSNINTALQNGAAVVSLTGDPQKDAIIKGYGNPVDGKYIIPAGTGGKHRAMFEREMGIK